MGDCGRPPSRGGAGPTQLGGTGETTDEAWQTAHGLAHVVGHQPIVMPAQAGIQSSVKHVSHGLWIPAFAGMTELSPR